MKKALFILLLLFSLPALQAGKAFADTWDCPMRVLRYERELNLSEKQESKIRRIQENMWTQMRKAEDNAASQIEEILTPQQRTKYKRVIDSDDTPSGRGYYWHHGHRHCPHY
jgi:hypothetical protein